jgi:hypothetical protein
MRRAALLAAGAAALAGGYVLGQATAPEQAPPRDPPAAGTRLLPAPPSLAGLAPAAPLPPLRVPPASTTEGGPALVVG